MSSLEKFSLRRGTYNIMEKKGERGDWKKKKDLTAHTVGNNQKGERSLV